MVVEVGGKTREPHGCGLKYFNFSRKSLHHLGVHVTLAREVLGAVHEVEPQLGAEAGQETGDQRVFQETEGPGQGVRSHLKHQL